jgi:hypothetical protein
MKRLAPYSAVLVCSLIVVLALAFAALSLFARQHKYALAGLIVALAALGLGWQEWKDARLYQRLVMQRPPFTTTDQSKAG